MAIRRMPTGRGRGSPDSSRPSWALGGFSGLDGEASSEGFCSCIGGVVVGNEISAMACLISRSFGLSISLFGHAWRFLYGQDKAGGSRQIDIAPDCISSLIRPVAILRARRHARG